MERIIMDNLKFGAFIAECRKEKGWTQRTLAEKINVTDKAVSKWERGLGFPDIKTIEPLADALGVSVLELIRAERIDEGNVTIEHAAGALENVIDLASYQEKISRRNLAIALVALIAFVVILFLADTMDWVGFVMVCLPVITLAVGVLLLLVSWIKYKRGTPWLATLIAGVVVLGYPMIIWVLFFLAGVFGIGPVPN